MKLASLSPISGQGAAADLRDDPHRRAVRGCAPWGTVSGMAMKWGEKRGKKPWTSMEIYGHLLKSIEIYGHLSTSQGKNRKKQSFRDGTCISESLGSLSEGNIFWENEFGFPIFRHLNGCPKWVTRCGWYGHSLALHQSISWTSLFLRGSYGKC